jgi:hypothetical protein
MPVKRGAPERAVSKPIFLQLATRAIRRVHFETQLLSLRQYDDSDHEDLIRRINLGMGVEVADESTVRDAIAQEFNASKLSHGWKRRQSHPPGTTKAGRNATKAGSRYFGVIEREVAYQHVGSDYVVEHVDLQYRRVPGPGEDDTTEHPVAPVELKRARLRRPDLKSGEPEIAPAPKLQRALILKDLRKLMRFVRAARKPDGLSRPAFLGNMKLEDGEQEKLQPHMLVWGLHRKGGKGTGKEGDPVTFMLGIFDELRTCGCKSRKKHLKIEWVPTHWAPHGEQAPPEVSAWIWVALAELRTARRDPTCAATCPCRTPPKRKKTA